MTDSTATPRLQPSSGEWFAEENDDGQGWRVLAANPPIAGSDDVVYYLIADDMTEADARLLVASKALVAAGQAVVSASESSMAMTNLAGAIAQLRAALAAAAGTG